MTSQPHLQPINSCPTTNHEASIFPTFPLFASLPIELRNKIWGYALRRQRFIRIHINNRKGKTASEAGENPESVKNGELYFTVVEGSQLLSKFLQVNKESREEALRFHRVHLPCRFTVGTAKEGPASHGILHFNPEWDYLYICADWPGKYTLVDFIHRLKIHDPRRVGILNLAVNRIGLFNMLSNYSYTKDEPLEINPESRSVFAKTLTQLREVWFVSTPLVGRQKVDLPGGRSAFRKSKPLFNRALPILSTTPTFEHLPRDPRSISKDLKNTYGLNASEDTLCDWLEMLNDWQISPQNITYRFFLAFEPRILGDKISDRASADVWLQKLEDGWNGQGPDYAILSKGWEVFDHDVTYRNEELENAVRPAFGFWLFPLEAFGRIGEDGLFLDGGSQPGGRRPRDMSEHWPELGLSSLP